MDSQERQDLEAFLGLAENLGWDHVIQAQASAYRVTSVSPDDVDYTSGDWDGSNAISNAPNPSDDEDAPSQLDRMFMAVPEDSRDAKSSWKLPFRSSPDGPVNTTAVSAIIGAINGARGGVEGIGQDTLRSIYDKAVQFGVEGGLYDEADDAPDFEGSASKVSNDLFDDQALTASAVGSPSVDESVDVDMYLEAQDPSALTGVIWGAGDHDLRLNGRPTPVHVPESTIPSTFEALKTDIEAGDVTIGFDHPPDSSVAAQTGIVDIGVPKGVALTADGQNIVLTDSELTNDQAAQAAEAGDFDGLDWSIVAGMTVERDDDGSVVTTEDGRVVLSAVRVTRIDAVDDGAVDAASIERGTEPLPDLADQVQTVTAAASASTGTNRIKASTALEASAEAILQHMQNHDFDPDVDDLDEARDQLSAAASIIDDQEDELKAAREKADGFTALLQANGVDPEDYDDPEAAAQAVIDEQTTETRREIAELEAELAAHDVDDVDDRVDDLAGQSPTELQNVLNARKAEAFDVQQKEQTVGAATSARDTTGSTNFSGGGGDGGDGDADEIALGAMDGGDRIKADAAGLSPSEYVAKEYDLQASQYDASDELQADILDELKGEA